MNSYPLGTLVRMSSKDPVTGAPFTNLDTGDAFDPTTVTLSYSDPTGSETTVPMIDLTHNGTGLWSFEVVGSIAGRWPYKFLGADNCDVASPDQAFYIDPSEL